MMRKRILIIGNYRSGTTQLMNGLANTFNLIPFREPFRPIPYNIQYELVDRMVTKTLIHQIPTEYTNSNFQFLDELRSEYDDVILLDRKNIDERLDSYLNVKVTNIWDTKYIDVSNKREALTSEVVDGMLKKTIATHNELLNYSNHTNLNITWYEDLYNENKDIVYNTISKWNLSKDMVWFDKFWKNYISIEHRYKLKSNLNKIQIYLK